MLVPVSRNALLALTLVCLAELVGCGSVSVEERPLLASRSSAVDALPPVQLIYAKGYNYGCSSCMTWGGIVEVENLAYDKEVTVAYQGIGGGAAGQVNAGYLTTLPSGRELWSFSGAGGNGTTQLRVRYQAAGRELWDNNGGWDYWGRIETVSGLGLVAVESPLGAAVDVAVTEATVTVPARGRPNIELWAQILVRNRAYEKHVQVIYSMDGWRTVQAADAAYQYGDGMGGELWQGHVIISPDATELSFAVSAKVGGSEAWDNNFGQNFTCKSDPLLIWHCTGSGLLLCAGSGGCKGQ